MIRGGKLRVAVEGAGKSGGRSPKETIMRTAVIGIFSVLIIAAAFALAQVAPPVPPVPAAPVVPRVDVNQVPATPLVPAVPAAPAIGRPELLVAQTTPPVPPVPAVPAVPATPAVPAMHSSGSYLGIDPNDVEADDVARLKLKEASGVEVTMVDQDSPAGKAGVREGDVILSFNGNKVNDSRDLKRYIRQTPPGQMVKLGISRDGQMREVQAKLQARQEAFSFNFHVPPMAMGPMNIEPPVVNLLQRRNGLTVESLSGQLAKYFGCKNGRGVLVRSVEHGTNADAAGFKAGDVIIGAANSSIENVADWTRVLRGEPGKINVKVLRDRREQTLSFNVPDRSRSDAESFSMPDMDEFNKQLAELRPQIEREVQRANEQVQHAMELRQKDLEKINTEEIRKEMERMRPEIEREIARANKEAKRAMELNQKDLQRQMEQMKRELERSLQDLKTHEEQ